MSIARKSGRKTSENENVISPMGHLRTLLE
jgi:hypothetical protein